MPKAQRDKKGSGREKRIKTLKVLGGLILLSSFITQNYFYDKWNSESEDILRAAEAQSLIDKSVLLNTALFYTSSLDRESFDEETLRSVRGQYIREAARKTYAAQLPRIAISPLSGEEKQRLLNNLGGWHNVKDFKSYSDYNRLVNELTKQYNPQIDEYSKELYPKRNVARNVYLGSYLIGSLLLLVGIAYERGNEGR